MKEDQTLKLLLNLARANYQDNESSVESPLPKTCTRKIYFSNIYFENLALNVFEQVVSIALAFQCILQYQLINIFSIKCCLRANLKIDVTKVKKLKSEKAKLKSEINSPGNFLLVLNMFV